MTFSLAEEFVYRGCFQALIVFWFRTTKFGDWIANGIVTILFAAQHESPDHQSYRFIITVPAGLFFGAIFARFGVLAAAAFHFAADMALTFVLPHLF